MSGNTTRLTAAIAESTWEVAGRAGGLMALFLLGVMIGAAARRVAESHAGEQRAREVVLGLVCAMAILSSWGVWMGNQRMAVLFLSVTIGAMNSVFERHGEVAISITYMTGTLVKMAQRFVDGYFFGGPRRIWLQYLAMWASLSSGALIGGLAYRAMGLRAVWLATGLLLAGSMVLVARRHRARVEARR